QVGDVNMGQITMRTDGIQEDPDDPGNYRAEVILRADYVPRNIAEFSFDISATDNLLGAPSASPFPFTVSRVAREEGGILWSWLSDPLLPVDIDGDVARVTVAMASPDGEDMRYGEFGDLLRLTFTGLPSPTPFYVNLVVDNSLYADPDPPSEDKYFIHPSAILVGADGRIAPAFPTALVRRITPVHADDPLNTFVIQATDNTVELSIENVGGIFPNNRSAYVALQWFLTLPSFLTLPPPPDDDYFGWVYEVGDIHTIPLTVVRDGKPGVLSGDILLSFFNGYNVTSASIHATTRILAATLNAPATVDCGSITQPTVEEVTFDIGNDGQSTLKWVMEDADLEALPAGVSISPTGGTLPFSFPTATQTVYIDSSVLPLGDFAFDVTVLATDLDKNPIGSVDIHFFGTILP
ncbi:MAG: hypothetical protein QG656_2329, partial [Candidatus Hydrogenedentes bacterium]|nr:hypothetical protein [Candidatus Hydrogenedentota bacterium]